MNISAPTAPASIKIENPAGRHLLSLRISPNGLHADYDPADLTEAAQIFVREMVRLAAPSELTNSGASCAPACEVRPNS